LALPSLRAENASPTRPQEIQPYGFSLSYFSIPLSQNLVANIGKKYKIYRSHAIRTQKKLKYSDHKSCF